MDRALGHFRGAAKSSGKGYAGVLTLWEFIKLYTYSFLLKHLNWVFWISSCKEESFVMNYKLLYLILISLNIYKNNFWKIHESDKYLKKWTDIFCFEWVDKSLEDYCRDSISEMIINIRLAFSYLQSLEILGPPGAA